jgi:hypothetical protein
MNPAAATNAAVSLTPSVRAKAQVKKPARKNVSVAANVNASASGISIPIQWNGSYTAGCAAAARMSPQRMNGFQSGHWPFASECRTARCHGTICACRSESWMLCGAATP